MEKLDEIVKQLDGQLVIPACSFNRVNGCTNVRYENRWVGVSQKQFEEWEEKRKYSHTYCTTCKRKYYGK